MGLERKKYQKEQICRGMGTKEGSGTRGRSIPPPVDNAKRDDAKVMSTPPMTVLFPQHHNTPLGKTYSPITNSPRTHRTRAPFLHALAILISSHHPTLPTYSLTLGVRRREGHGGRHGSGRGCLRGIEGWIRTCIGERILIRQV